MTVQQIIEEWLKAHGYDGLYQAGECACEIGDLVPCSEDPSSCEAGYKTPCDCGEHNWHISSAEVAKHISNKEGPESQPQRQQCSVVWGGRYDGGPHRCVKERGHEGPCVCHCHKGHGSDKKRTGE